MAQDLDTQVLALRADVVATALEREAVLLDLQTKYFYTVNSSGWAITQLFESGCTRADALKHTEIWGASNGDAAAVESFIASLISEKLIEPGAAPAPNNDITFDGPWRAPSLDKHKEPLQRVMISAFDPTLPLAE